MRLREPDICSAWYLSTFQRALAGSGWTTAGGEGTVAGVTLGPLINRAAAEKVNRHIDDALSRGATLLAGGITAGIASLCSQRFWVTSAKKC